MPDLAAPRIGAWDSGADHLGNGHADRREARVGRPADNPPVRYISGRPRDASPTKVEDMVGIILEGVLFVALLATVATLLFYALVRWTPLGLRLRQDANRRKIEQALDLNCPIHGPQREEEMVRLPSGSRICPTCYKEALHE
jgi:hypothetical protein